MRVKLIFAVLAISLCSCSFNRSFYQAQPIPAGAKKATLQNKTADSAWTTTISFGPGAQPTFLDAKEQEMPLPYVVESIMVKNKEGHDLNCWMMQPAKRNVAKANVLFLHGNGGNIISHYHAAAQLAQRGYNVCIVDYSGYGFSGGHCTREGIRNDATYALKALLARPETRGLKTIIYGQSLGGHLAATVAMDNETYIDGVAIEGAFSSHKDVAARMIRPAGIIARILVSEQYSATRSIRAFHKPVLVIHSPEDEMIPYRMGRKIYAVANMPKTFYEIGHGHIEGLTYYADSIDARISKMLE